MLTQTEAAALAHVVITGLYPMNSRVSTRRGISLFLRPNAHRPGAYTVRPDAPTTYKDTPLWRAHECLIAEGFHVLRRLRYGKIEYARLADAGGWRAVSGRGLVTFESLVFRPKTHWCGVVEKPDDVPRDILNAPTDFYGPVGSP